MFLLLLGFPCLFSSGLSFECRNLGFLGVSRVCSGCCFRSLGNLNFRQSFCYDCFSFDFTGCPLEFKYHYWSVSAQFTLKFYFDNV